MNSCEFMQVLLDCVTSGQVGARDILTSVRAAGLASGLSVPTVQQALTAGEPRRSIKRRPSERTTISSLEAVRPARLLLASPPRPVPTFWWLSQEAMIPARRSAIPVSASTMLAVRSTGRCRSPRFLS
jgi:hypothetical protein